MQENRERIVDAERLTDAEIMRAIRYLDPDIYGERTREDASTILVICITLLIFFTGALAYVYLLTRML